MRSSAAPVRALAAVACLAAGSTRAQVLTELPTFVSTGVKNSNVVLATPDERMLLVSNQQSATVTALAIADDGTLSLLASSPTGSTPTGMVLNPTGDRLYVATGDGLRVHAVEPGGALPLLQALPPAVPGMQPHTGLQYATVPVGDLVYANESVSPNAVSAYRVAADGTLSFAASYATGGSGALGSYAAPRLLEAHGTRLFAGNTGSVSVFEILPDGSLLLVPGSPFTSPLPPAAPVLPLPAPSLALDPSGAALYAALDGLTVLRFLVGPDGALAFDAAFPSNATAGLNGLVVHPSGRWLAGGFGASGLRLWDTTAPGAPVQVISTAAGLAWSRDGRRAWVGGGSLTLMRVRTFAFGPPPGAPIVTCTGTPGARTALPGQAGVCGALLDPNHRSGGGCSDGGAGLASCTYDGQPSVVLGPGAADVVIVATSPSGDTASCTSYLDVRDGVAPSLSCSAPATVECTGALTPVPVEASCRDNCSCQVSCSAAALAPGPGAVKCTATDPSGNAGGPCTMPVEVVDTSPPMVTVAASPLVLWPPDHRLVPIVLAVTARDACDPAPAVACAVASSEAEAGPGAHGPDVVWQDGQLYLRAERLGSGSARTYTIACTARDAAGQTASASAEVTVPHDARP